jgi:CheY-like chemotaxis protein
MSTVLLIDDDDDIRQIFTIYLNKKGHTIHSAPGGREGIDMLGTVHPDLILLDIMMPGMDGWETLCAIKKNPATKNLPVTMCSGKQPDRDEINRYGKYIEDYLLKPLELPKLSDALVSIIQHYRKQTAEMESLKNKIPDHQMIDEFYDCQKTLRILEKISKLLTSGSREIEADIRRYKTHMQEICGSQGDPYFRGALAPSPKLNKSGVSNI